MRGSTPCAGHETRRYGGNTSCVVLEAPGERPVLLDLGTGLRYFGLGQPTDGSFDGIALVSHLHWDHVQGIPFFTPINRLGARLDVFGPRQDDTSLEDAVRSFINPPYFPVSIDVLAGTFTFRALDAERITVDGWEVTAAPVPHIGPTLGFRVEIGGVSVAYVSDHQQPGCGATDVDPVVLDLCRDVDLLIHDAQYTDPEFVDRFDWGHCTIDYAVEVAQQAGAHRLVLFHHDPGHTDQLIDSETAAAAGRAAAVGVGEVIAAAEGLSISLTPRPGR